MDLKLQGKTALVTGGSEGIGKGIAWALAKEGVDVAICARRKEPLEAAAKEIAQATGRKIAFFAGSATLAERVLTVELDTGAQEVVKVSNSAHVDAGSLESGGERIHQIGKMGEAQISGD